MARTSQHKPFRFESQRLHSWQQQPDLPCLISIRYLLKTRSPTKNSVFAKGGRGDPREVFLLLTSIKSSFNELTAMHAMSHKCMHVISLNFYVKACASFISQRCTPLTRWRNFGSRNRWWYDLPGCGHWLKLSPHGSRAPCQGSTLNAACSVTSWTLLTPANNTSH